MPSPLVETYECYDTEARTPQLSYQQVQANNESVERSRLMRVGPVTVQEKIQHGKTFLEEVYRVWAFCKCFPEEMSSSMKVLSARYTFVCISLCRWKVQSSSTSVASLQQEHLPQRFFVRNGMMSRIFLRLFEKIRKI